MPNQEFEQRLMRKITWRLVPLLSVAFMAAFVDRVNVGFAKESMGRDLELSSAVYGFGAGVFFLGYFLFEVPSNLVMVRVGARRWIARIMVVWGVVSACMMLVQGATGFYLLRFLLGASEAGFFPGIILYLTTWYPAAYRTRAIALFMTAAVLSNVIGSPLSGLLLELDGTSGLRGWQWLFLCEGVPSVVLGVAVLLWLPNGPRDAKWLSPDELRWLTARLAAEPTEVDQATPLWRVLVDPRVLWLSAVYASNVIGGYGLDFFMPTLIHEALPALPPVLVGLLNAIPPLLAVFVMLAHGHSSDRRGERRWHFAGAAFAAAVGLVMASLSIPPAVALLALTLAVSGRWSAIAPFWGLATTLLSGRVATAAAAIAFINSVGNLGGFAGPFMMGWLKDHTGDYALGLRLLGVVVALGGAAALGFRARRASP